MNHIFSSILRFGTSLLLISQCRVAELHIGFLANLEVSSHRLDSLPQSEANSYLESQLELDFAELQGPQHGPWASKREFNTLIDLSKGNLHNLIKFFNQKYKAPT